MLRGRWCQTISTPILLFTTDAHNWRFFLTRMKSLTEKLIIAIFYCQLKKKREIEISSRWPKVMNGLISLTIRMFKTRSNKWFANYGISTGSFDGEQKHRLWWKINEINAEGEHNRAMCSWYRQFWLGVWIQDCLESLVWLATRWDKADLSQFWLWFVIKY